MNRIIFLVLLICLNFFYSFSQISISGFVYNDNCADTLIPLARVKVVLTSQNTKDVTKTNKSGFYSLKLEDAGDTVNILFQRKRYSSIDVELLVGSEKEDKRLDILLRRLYSLHDEKYTGASEILLLKKSQAP